MSPKVINHVDVDINLARSQGDDQRYSSDEVVSGNIVLKFKKALLVSNVIVTFEGSTFTCFKNPDAITTARGRCIGQHRFMTMECPIDEEHLPSHVQQGQTNTIPFRFSIPQRLLPGACSHPDSDHMFQAQHTLMPPSITVNKKVIIEDGVTVDAAKITYGIRVRVVQQSDSNQPVDCGLRFKEVLVVPATPSDQPYEPPYEIPRLDVSLQPSKQNTQGPGRLVVEGVNPDTFQLPSPRSLQKQPILQSTTVFLRYEPSMAEETPPQISKIDVKLGLQSFYNVRAFRNQPSVEESTQRGYSHLLETLPNPSLTLSNVDWQLGPSDSCTFKPQPSCMWIPGRPSYSAHISKIPITLSPSDYYTRLTPSFASCTVVRQYFVNLDLHFPNCKPNILSLRVPINISVEPSAPISAPSYSPQLQADAFEMGNLPEDLAEQLPAYDETVLRTLMVDGNAKTLAYVKSEPWLNWHNGFGYGLRKLKGHLETRKARQSRSEA